MASRITTPFKKHLSFFGRSSDGNITFYSALRASLALGMNFPASCMLGAGLPLLYGNTGPLRSQVDIAKVSIERPQLQALGEPSKDATYSRADLLKAVRNDTWIDWMHVLQFWNLAADVKTGLVSGKDLAMFQRGELMPELARRRKSREAALPFLRGGPFS